MWEWQESWQVPADAAEAAGAEAAEAAGAEAAEAAGAAATAVGDGDGEGELFAYDNAADAAADPPKRALTPRARVAPIDDIVSSATAMTREGEHAARVRAGLNARLVLVPDFGWIIGRSLATLLDSSYVNDEVINAIGCLATRGTDAAAISSHFAEAIARPTPDLLAAGRFTRSLVSRRTFLIPLNTPGNGAAAGHWSLLSLDRTARTITLYDSLHPRALPLLVRHAVAALPRWLDTYDHRGTAELLSYDTSIAPEDVMPRQPNSYDCGVYVAVAMACIARGVTPAAALRACDPARLRSSLLHFLLSSHSDPPRTGPS
jgi:Ulp1 protease family, C-terminal catalytic domain